MERLLSLIRAQPISSYKLWKERRREIIETLQPELQRMTEQELEMTFKAWESLLLDERPLNELITILTISYYFQRNVLVVKNQKKVARNLLSNDDLVIVRAAMKLIYWVVSDGQEPGSVLPEPIRLLSTWINGDDQGLLRSCVIILNQLRRLKVLDVIMRKMTGHCQAIIRVAALDPEEAVRRKAIKCLAYYIRHFHVQKYRDKLEGLFDTWKQNITDPTPESCIVCQLLCYCCIYHIDLFVRQVDSVVAMLLNMFRVMKHSNCCRVFLKLSKVALDSMNTELVREFVTVLTESIDEIPGLIPCIAEVIEVCWEKLNVEEVLAVLKPRLVHGHHGHKVCPYQILEKIITKGQCSLDESYFATDRYCKHFAKCLSMQPELANSYKEKIIEYRRGSAEIDNIYLAGYFHGILFNDTKEVFDMFNKTMDTKPVKTRKSIVKCAAIIGDREAMNFLIETGLYDDSKDVRTLALTKMKIHPTDASHVQILQTLNDSSYRVRRAGIRLVKELHDINPLLVHPTVVVYQKEILSVLRTSIDVKVVAKVASLLYEMCNCRLEISDQFLLDTVTIISDYLQETFDKSIENRKIMELPALVVNKNVKMHALQRFIRDISQEKYTMKRESYFIKTLGVLGGYTNDLRHPVMNSYAMVLDVWRSTELILLAADSMLEWAFDLLPTMTERLRSTRLGNAILDALAKTTHEKLAMKFLLIVGLHFDKRDTNNWQAMYNHFPMENADDPMYFTDSVMTILMPYFSEGKQTVFEAFAIICQKYPQSARKYLHSVLPFFFQIIEKHDGNSKDQYFEYLEMIFIGCKEDCYYFLPALDTILDTFFTRSTKCVKFCAALSIKYKQAFHAGASLYPIALSMLSSGIQDQFCIKYVTKFIAFSILYQGQALGAYMYALEEGRGNFDEMTAKYIAKSLILVLLNNVTSEYSIRMAQFIYKFRDTKEKNIEYLWNLTCTLSERIMRFNYHRYSYTRVEILEPKIKFDFASCSEEEFTGDLTTLKYAGEQGIDEFFEELFQISVNISREPVIRACKKICHGLPELQKKLLPCCFLSAWKDVGEHERVIFSNIINRILTEHVNIPSMILLLIEIADRYGKPILIDEKAIGQYVSSRQFTLCLLQRMYMKNPKDMNVIHKMLDINVYMNQVESIRSLFNKIKHNLDMNEAGEWYESLNDWKSALELYQREGASFTKIVHALNHLDRYDDVLKYEDEFENSSREDRQMAEADFAWSYFRLGKDDKLEAMMEDFRKDARVSKLVFSTIYDLSLKNWKRAGRHIRAGFGLLANQKEVLSMGNRYQIQRILNYCQVFSEAYEMIRVYTGEGRHVDNVKKGWFHRIKGYQRTRTVWINMLMLQRIVLPIDHHREYYLKVIGQLRKEREFDLIDYFFGNLLSSATSFDILLADLKVKWAKGDKVAASSECRRMCNDLKHLSYDDFIQKVTEKINASDGGFINMLVSHRMMIPEIETLCRNEFGTSLNKVDDILDKKPIEARRAFVHDIISQFGSSMYSNYEQLLSVAQNMRKHSAKLYRLCGTYIYELGNDSIEKIKEARSYIEKSISLDPTSPKAQRVWAYVNGRLSKMDEKNNLSYTIIATKAWHEAYKLCPEYGLEAICQIVFLGGQCDYKGQLNRVVMPGITPDLIMRTLPQMMYGLIHRDKTVRDQDSAVLIDFGKEHFQAILCHLMFYSMTFPDSAAPYVLETLSQMHPQVAEDGQLFVNGMIQAAFTKLEDWVQKLEGIVRFQRDQPIEPWLRRVNDFFVSFDSATCELDLIFQKGCAKPAEAIRSYLKSKNYGMLLTTARTFLTELREKEAKLSTIFLSRVSAELAEKRDMVIAPPGCYSIDGNYQRIHRIEPTMEVLPTQQHPRAIVLVTSEGQRKKYLLKAGEDLRLDERLMQLFHFANHILRSDLSTQDIGTFIARYPIFPLTTKIGLISWVTGADTLHQIVADHRQARGIAFNHDQATISEVVKPTFQMLNGLQRLEIFNEVAPKLPATELFDWMWLRSPSSSIWLQRREKYTSTSALMSIAGYIIGLGDRHPGNIMVQRETGRIIHIDFGESFDSTVLRKSQPERVPFRLTRMMVNAMIGCCHDGKFQTIAENVMKVLRENSFSIYAQLEIFVTEPLADRENVMGEGGKRFTTRLNAKLTGNEIKGKTMNVHEQVEYLINQAADPANYVRHYSGWCPFW